MKSLHLVSWILVIIGGLNWLLFGILGQELGTWIGGMDSLIARIIYILIGVAAILELITHKKACKDCSVKKTADMPPAAPPQQPTNPGM